MIRKRRYRIFFTVTALFVSALYAIYQGGALAWHLLGFLLVLLLVALVGQSGPLSHVFVQRKVHSGPYHAGDTLNVHLNIQFSRSWIWPWLTITDQISESLTSAPPHFVIYPGRQHSTSLSYQIPELKRGIYRLENILLSTGDWFGLFHRTLQTSSDTTIVVWPATTKIGASTLFSRIWHGDNRARRPTREESTHMRGVREYVPGDRLSQIHWKTSAHTGDFKVKQFEPDTKPELTILLDRSHWFNPQEWELALAIAASLLEHSYHQQQSVGLVALDEPEDWFSPALGPQHFPDMMNFLSQLDYGPDSHVIARPALWQDSRLVAITTPKRREQWEHTAVAIIAVGDPSLLQLAQLDAYLKPSQSGWGTSQ